MDFAVMGTISSYVKQKNLTFAAKHRIRTGQTLTNANGNFISMTTSTFQKLAQASKSSNDAAKQQKIRRIKQKLHAGQKLSDEELGFLRVNDPKTYKKAKAAAEARDELKAELKKAKSKSEAREALSRAMLKASSAAMAELGALGQGGGTSAGGNSGEVSAGSENISGEVSAGSENISGEVSAGNENVSGDKVSAGNENVSGDKTSAEKISSAQKNSDSDEMTPEDILEKYIWTIRALEDEWNRFTNSDEYKNLSDHISDEVSHFDSRKFLKVVAAYRKAMFNRNWE